MTEPRTRTQLGTTLVWIDAREAVIVRGVTPEVFDPVIERLESDVPAHHKSGGHVRHVPPNYGSGAPESGEERRRLEHLARFVATVAEHLPPDQHLLILGPGTVREHLERKVRDDDTHHAPHSHHREVLCEPASRMSDRQLVAMLRSQVGVLPKRIGTGPREETP